MLMINEQDRNFTSKSRLVATV